MDLRGKVALVTGAARRVGRAIALALAREGMDLAVHYHRSHSEAEATAGQIRRLGRRAELFVADLADPAAIEALLAAVGAAFGRLDVLVNNASVCERTPLETLDAADWDRILAVNARAPALCIRHAIPLLKAGRGAVVNVTDLAAEKPWAGYGAYCASKAALRALTGSTAKALAPYGIRASAVAPGVAAWQEGVTEAQKEQVLSQVPLRRPGTPEDIAAAVVFLAQSDYITGQTLRVDGGGCMR